jgi:hypothetical protein
MHALLFVPVRLWCTAFQSAKKWGLLRVLPVHSTVMAKNFAMTESLRSSNQKPNSKFKIQRSNFKKGSAKHAQLKTCKAT